MVTCYIAQLSDTKREQGLVPGRENPMCERGAEFEHQRKNKQASGAGTDTRAGGAKKEGGKMSPGRVLQAPGDSGGQ